MTGSRVPAWRSEHPTIRWGAYAWAFVGLALAFALAWRGLGYVRIVVAPLSIALFLAAILTPPARWLEERRFPPALASFTTLLVFVLIVGGVGYLITLNVQSQLQGVTDQLQQTYRDVEPRIEQLPFLPSADALFGEVTDGEGGSSEQGGNGDGSSDDASSDGGSSDEGGAGASIGQTAQEAAVAAVVGVGRFVTEFFIFLVATFFYIKDRRRIARFLSRLFPQERRGTAAELLRQTWDTVGGYIRGQAIIAAIDGVLVAIGLVIVGIPLAVTLGVLVFLGAFVPTVGSIVAGTVAVTVALVTEGLAGALITLAIIVGVQQFEGNFLAPVILGRSVHIHPLAVLVAVVAGAVLLGVWGAVIGVPLAASLYRAAGYLRDEGDLEGVEASG